LAAILDAPIDARAKQQRVAQWAMHAFQQAGVDQVRAEYNPLPSWALSPAQNRVTGPQQTNVVAEIGGRENPREFVILAAPLDTRGSGASALATVSNAAVLVDAARAIHAAGLRPLRSIRFLLFDQTNGKPFGSLAYVLAHRDEIDQADSAIIYDAGMAPVTGYDLDGRKSIEAPLRNALAPAAQFHANHDSFTPTLDAGSFDFLLEGVPTLVTNRDSAFRPPATFDFAVLKWNAAFVAVSAYAVADLPERLAPRQTRSQIEQLIARTGIESKMKSLGIWSQWRSGKRGRH
jgi:hypothetical protein